MRSARERGGRHCARDGGDLRSTRGDHGTRRAEHRARRLQSAGELRSWRLSALQEWPADHALLATLNAQLSTLSAHFSPLKLRSARLLKSSPAWLTPCRKIS